MKKLKVHLDICAGCKRCENACAAAHVSEAFPEPVPRIHVESQGGDPAPLVCRHCVDAPCVSACMSGAMQKDPATGVVSNEGHEQKCVGCWMCVMACPYGVIAPSVDATKKQSTFAQAVKCDLCPQRDTPACVEACPNHVLELADVPEQEAVV